MNDQFQTLWELENQMRSDKAFTEDIDGMFIYSKGFSKANDIGLKSI